ncbi:MULTISPECIES: endolytic transglycosylase MltG [Atopobiaceae]|uniref:Endolytic murein transglycosylase n=1 Tax=Parafannyhessea umbonata TaxID=604330 RepID=A0A1H6J3Y6_9ACTN|nr:MULTISPECIES: endolytic transglycosylase MltG [Atopobiaceae]SEH54189.1 UPF0755 protein [Parafannyhessea umbonata]SJZ46312.1 UPF0755 protein [Olsenella sp. KH1P3]
MADKPTRRAAHFAGVAPTPRREHATAKASKPAGGAKGAPARKAAGNRKAADARKERRQPVSRTGAQKPHAARGVSSHSARTTSRTNRGQRGQQRRCGRRSWLPLAGIALVLLALSLVVFVLPRLGREQDSASSGVSQGDYVSVTIPEGSGANAIAKILLEAGVIDDKKVFLEEVDSQRAESNMKPGTYKLMAGGNISGIVRQLCEGPNSDEGRLTVAEGLTVAKTAEAVQKQLGISSDEFLAQAKASNYVDDYPFLSEAQDDSLEGFLYPKTYDFSGKDVSADSVIRAMLDQYKAEVHSLNMSDAAASLSSSYGVTVSDYDVLKVASIIEREAVTSDDRPLVSSVIYNRLKADMSLQSDATMGYVTGGDVTADDLKVDSPYNTYLHKGLTPTPICSPSLDSIQAALAPSPTNYYYFLIIENGSYSNHTFSETYDQHQEAIAKAQADQGV